MKIVINPHNLVPNNSWQEFRKVRAVIENEMGSFALSMEGGKYIFPGGKCEKDEDELTAIQREVQEETGLLFDLSEFHKVLELETFYEDFYDFRSNSLRPRHTITTYYTIHTKDNINFDGMSLTDGEKEQNFHIFFADKDTLLKMLLEDHSDQENGKFFDEENRVVASKILQK